MVCAEVDDVATTTTATRADNAQRLCRHFCILAKASLLCRPLERRSTGSVQLGGFVSLLFRLFAVFLLFAGVFVVGGLFKPPEQNEFPLFARDKSRTGRYVAAVMGRLTRLDLDAVAGGEHKTGEYGGDATHQNLDRTPKVPTVTSSTSAPALRSRSNRRICR
jgi:hypothetical protein